MERIVEPELMDDPLQARAYAEADFDRSDQAFTERFLAFFASPPPCPRPGCWVSMGRPAWWPSPQNISSAGAVQSREASGDLSGPPYLPHPLRRLARLRGVVRARH